MTFVSFLVPVKLVWKVGLPFKEFFIWGDDLEYSLRLARVTRIYQVGKSKVTHMKSGDASLNIAHERDNDKIWQYRLAYRNRLFIIHKYDGVISTQTARFIFRSFRDIFLSIRSGTSVLMKCKTILYGAFSGIVFSAKMAKKDGSIIPAEIVAGAKERERQNVA